MSWWDKTPFSVLKGKIVTSITGAKNDEEMIFVCDDGTEYMMYHDHDCCEIVDIDDICGDLSALLGTPILLAEEVSSDEDGESFDRTRESVEESYTWTFYKLATVKGYVTIRWFGCSNGYYSEEVSFKEVQ